MARTGAGSGLRAGRRSREAARAGGRSACRGRRRRARRRGPWLRCDAAQLPATGYWASSGGCRCRRAAARRVGMMRCGSMFLLLGWLRAAAASSSSSRGCWIYQKRPNCTAPASEAGCAGAGVVVVRLLNTVWCAVLRCGSMFCWAGCGGAPADRRARGALGARVSPVSLSRLLQGWQDRPQNPPVHG